MSKNHPTVLEAVGGQGGARGEGREGVPGSGSRVFRGQRNASARGVGKVSSGRGMAPCRWFPDGGRTPGVCAEAHLCQRQGPGLRSLVGSPAFIHSFIRSAPSSVPRCWLRSVPWGDREAVLTGRRSNRHGWLESPDGGGWLNTRWGGPWRWAPKPFLRVSRDSQEELGDKALSIPAGPRATVQKPSFPV